MRKPILITIISLLIVFTLAPMASAEKGHKVFTILDASEVSASLMFSHKSVTVSEGKITVELPDGKVLMETFAQDQKLDDAGELSKLLWAKKIPHTSVTVREWEVLIEGLDEGDVSKVAKLLDIRDQKKAIDRLNKRMGF